MGNHRALLQEAGTTHKRAHRNPKENKQQILESYYFPRMTSRIKEYTKTCETCQLNKYDRQAFNQKIKDTRMPCEILHLDILKSKGQIFKSVKFFSIKNKSAVHLRH